MNHRNRAFTLIEVLVAAAIMSLLIALMGGAIGEISRVMKVTSSKIDAFQGARIGIGKITQTLSLATLDSRLNYFNLKENIFCDESPTPLTPDCYRRQSDLQFIAGNSKEILDQNFPTHAVFFQAPLDYTEDRDRYGKTSQLLNACGFYIEFGKDEDRPGFLSFLGSPLNARYRYRLMMMLVPFEKVNIFSTPDNNILSKKWYQDDLKQYSHPLVENIVAMVVTCKRRDPSYGQNSNGEFYLPVSSNESSYLYDSKTPPGKGNMQAESSNQLPPIVQITLVSIDETSARLLASSNDDQDPHLIPAGLFQDPIRYGDDMRELEEILQAKVGNRSGNKVPCQYRIYSFDVNIQSSSWKSQS